MLDKNERKRKKLMKRICVTTNELFRLLAKTNDEKLKKAYTNFIQAHYDYDAFCEKNPLFPKRCNE